MQRQDRIDQLKTELATHIKTLQNHESYQIDLDCVEQACKPDASPQQLTDLYMRMHMHESVVTNHKGAGVFGGLVGVGLMCTGGISFFYSFGLSSAFSSGMFATGVGMLGTAIGVPVVSVQRDGKIGQIQKTILYQLNKNMLSNKKYDAYAITTLMIIEKLAELTTTPEVEKAQLRNCIRRQIPSLNPHDLYDIAHTLAENLLLNLYRIQSKIAPSVKTLLDFLCLQMIKNQDYSGYIKIKLIIILNKAKLRDKEAGTDKEIRNHAINDAIEAVNKHCAVEDIQAALNYAITLSLSESKTSKAAIDMEKLINEFHQLINLQENKKEKAVRLTKSV